MALARGTDREHEIAIRSALGARRLRLIRQLLTENIVLGLLGSAAGLGLGYAMMRGIIPSLPPDMLPPQANVRMDYGVLLFTMAIGILTAVLFGLAPALSGTRPDLTRSLKEGGRTTAGFTRHRMRCSPGGCRSGAVICIARGCRPVDPKLQQALKPQPGRGYKQCSCNGSSDARGQNSRTAQCSQTILRKSPKTSEACRVCVTRPSLIDHRWKVLGQRRGLPDRRAGAICPTPSGQPVDSRW